MHNDLSKRATQQRIDESAKKLEAALASRKNFGKYNADAVRRLLAIVRKKRFAS